MFHNLKYLRVIIAKSVEDNNSHTEYTFKIFELCGWMIYFMLGVELTIKTVL